jgi:transposase-like protein
MKIIEEVISMDGSTPEIEIISLVFHFPQKEIPQSRSANKENPKIFHETQKLLHNVLH